MDRWDVWVVGWGAQAGKLAGGVSRWEGAPGQRENHWRARGRRRAVQRILPVSPSPLAAPPHKEKNAFTKPPASACVNVHSFFVSFPACHLLPCSTGPTKRRASPRCLATGAHDPASLCCPAAPARAWWVDAWVAWQAGWLVADWVALRLNG